VSLATLLFVVLIALLIIKEQFMLLSSDTLYINVTFQ